jgi:hypothetical protein
MRHPLSFKDRDHMNMAWSSSIHSFIVNYDERGPRQMNRELSLAEYITMKIIISGKGDSSGIKGNVDASVMPSLYI